MGYQEKSNIWEMFGNVTCVIVIFMVANDDSNMVNVAITIVCGASECT